MRPCAELSGLNQQRSAIARMILEINSGPMYT
jgi:ABC-type phosphate/phosphonate transport system ATPase subunit